MKSLPLIKEIKKHPNLNQKGKIYAITSRHTFSAPFVSDNLDYIVKLKKHYPELTVNYLPVDIPISLKFANYKN